MLVGAHVSIADGIYQAVARAEGLRCETFQIFSKSPRGLRDKLLDEGAASRFRDALGKSKLKRPMIHDNYLINLASPDTRMSKVYRKAFVDEMERAQRLCVPYLVFHPGAHVGKGEEYALKRIAKNLDWCIENANAQDVTLCMENTAGQGSVIGYKFEHLKSIRDQVKEGDRLAVCFDTCHAFAAGYDISILSGYERVMGEIDDLMGLEMLTVFHLNDSIGKLGSRRDRHQHIGRGELGKEVFRYLLNDQRFKDCPGNIETPDEGNWNRKNLRALKSLRNP